MTEVPSLPLLAPWVRVVGDGERLLLEYAQSLVVLEGAAVRALLPSLLPLLDGRHDLDALSRRLGEPARPAIEAAVELLREQGVLVDGPDAASEIRSGAHAVAAAHGLSPAEASARLRSASIGVVGGSPLRIDVVRLLHEAGVGQIRRLSWNTRSQSDLVVVAPDRAEGDRLPAWNASALRSGNRWLLLRAYDGRFASAGPIVIPGQTCCYECLLLRRGANAGYADELVDVEAAPLAAGFDPGLGAFAAALAAHLAVRWLVGGDKTMPGVLFTLEAQPALCLREHAVLRVPRCSVCSSAAHTAPPLPWHQAVAA